MGLRPDGYRNRLIDSRIEEYLRTFGAVNIEGPKWCGKTWSARNQSNSEFQLDEKNTVLVQLDKSFALSGDSPRLIDEWQRVPSIWDEIMFHIDRTGTKGQFIICGSSTPSMEQAFHSEAGKIGSLIMHTMSLYETGDSDGFASLNRMFDGNLETSSIQEIELNHLIKLVIRGGWPGLLDSNTNATIANKDYLDKICNIDSTRIDGKKRNPHKMSLLIKSLARNESTVVSDNSIIRDIKEYDNESISETTLSDYRNVLERLFVIRYQPAFNPYIRSSIRVGKTPKKRLADPSLAAAALGLTEKNAIDNLEYFGFLFKSLCEHDLEVYAEHLGGKLYHYRDNYNNEIDAVVELPDGRWGAFEIKLGFHQVDKAAENLLRLKNRFKAEGKVPSVLCVICGMSVASFRRPDGVFVVPITRLGP